MYLTLTHLKDVLDKKKDINIFISDRSGRKTSVVQDFFIHEAERGRPFILLRTKKDEIISESWLSNYILNKYNDKGYVFVTEKINTNITAIYLITPEAEKILFCYGLWVSLAAKYKSNYFSGFESVRYVLWEECVPNNPIHQRIQHIKQTCMNDMLSVLSIGSTVARDNKIQYIFLGNDISSNILNPVTVSFDLLERLQPDTPIEDKATINDREYSFYFEYFSFKNSVEHWATNPDFDIDSTITVKDVNKARDFIIKTKFNTYTIYSNHGFEYIAPYIKGQKDINLIYDVGAFFAYYGLTDLYNKYPLGLALNFAVTLYGVPLYDIQQYFGALWKTAPRFIPQKSAGNRPIIDLEKISKMKLNTLINAPEFNVILELNHLLQNYNIVYHNMKLKVELERLKDILIFYK